MSDFIKRARAFYKELDALEEKYRVSLNCGYSQPGDDENYLMLSDWNDKGRTFVRLFDLDDAIVPALILGGGK